MVFQVSGRPKLLLLVQLSLRATVYEWVSRWCHGWTSDSRWQHTLNKLLRLAALDWVRHLNRLRWSINKQACRVVRLLRVSLLRGCHLLVLWCVVSDVRCSIATAYARRNWIQVLSSRYIIVAYILNLWASWSCSTNRCCHGCVSWWYIALFELFLQLLLLLPLASDLLLCILLHAVKLLLLLLVKLDWRSLSWYLVWHKALVNRVANTLSACVKLLDDNLWHMLSECWGLLMWIGGRVSTWVSVVWANTSVIVGVKGLSWSQYLAETACNSTFRLISYKLAKGLLVLLLLLRSWRLLSDVLWSSSSTCIYWWWS